MPFVIDASALLFATSDPEPGARRLLGRLRDEVVHAPHLIDAELGAVIRRKVLRDEMAEDRATAILSSYPALVDHRYEHHGLLAALAWQLRDNLSFYDALYVGLGASLELEVITLDTRVVNAPGLPTRVTIATA